MNFIEKLPIWASLAALILCVTFPLCFFLNALLKRTIVSNDLQNDASGWLSGSVFSAQSSLFSFLSATLVAVLIAQRVQIISSMNKESSGLLSLSSLANACNKKVENFIDQSIKKYIQHVVQNEWKIMGQEKKDWKTGRNIMIDLKDNLLEEKGFLEKNIGERVLNRISDVLDGRLERIQSSCAHIPNYVWSLHYISSFLVLLGLGFYPIHRKSMHILLMLAISTVVSTTIISLSYLRPSFNQKIGSISPHSFLDVLEYLKDQE